MQLTVIYRQFIGPDFLDQLNEFLSGYTSVIAVQHVGFVHTSRDDVMANKPSGATYMVTLQRR